MLFWIFVILTVAGILYCIFNRYGEFEDVVSFMTTICGVVTIVMLLIITIEHTGVDGYIAKKNARREALVWQLENDVYENDNDLGKRELITDIQEWNENLASSQALQNDFWIGIFFADIYDRFEPIPLQ